MPLTWSPSVSVAIWSVEESCIAQTLRGPGLCSVLFHLAPQDSASETRAFQELRKSNYKSSILILALLAFLLPLLFVIPSRLKAFCLMGNCTVTMILKNSSFTFGTTLTSKT